MRLNLITDASLDAVGVTFAPVDRLRRAADRTRMFGPLSSYFLLCWKRTRSRDTTVQKLPLAAQEKRPLMTGWSVTGVASQHTESIYKDRLVRQIIRKVEHVCILYSESLSEIGRPKAGEGRRHAILLAYESYAARKGCRKPAVVSSLLAKAASTLFGLTK